MIAPTQDPRQHYLRARKELGSTALMTVTERMNLKAVFDYVDGLEAAMQQLVSRASQAAHAENLGRLLAAASVDAPDRKLVIKNDTIKNLPKDLRMNVDVREDQHIVEVLP